MSEFGETPLTNRGPRPVFCRRCGLEIAAQDRFCRHCGRPVGAAAEVIGAEAVAVAPARVGPRYSWYENVWFVLGMLFLVLGPLALPLLWRSRQFSLLWKIVLTLLVGLLTVFILAQVWYIFNTYLAELQKALGP